LGTRTVPFIQAPNEACVKEFLFPGNKHEFINSGPPVATRTIKK
jgi:hypothetical protein